MAISDEGLHAAAAALSDAARGENIYLPAAKARRIVEPALEAAIEIVRRRSANPRIERTRAMIREAIESQRPGL
ncbi:MAG: hypothetical protein QHC65_10835 [Sphingomonas sp.]|nr:hypothetical protein [Sphingomonas sp.]MDX3884908.1 hypothetical protein [Sphingomonas sp.]